MFLVKCDCSILKGRSVGLVSEYCFDDMNYKYSRVEMSVGFVFCSDDMLWC